MKKFTKMITIIAIIGISITYSCKKDAEAVIDCFGDALLYDLSHTIDTLDTKMAILKVTYYGDHSLDNSIKWDFGDGEVKTLSGAETQHTYSESGTYTVKAEVTTRNEDAYCTHELHETVDIN